MSSNFLNKNSSESGFTLLEVLISMSVLVMISFGIYQATTETYKLRDSLSIEGNFYNAITLSLSIIQRDISLIYSPVALLPPAPKKDANTPPDAKQMNVIMSDDLGRSFNFWSAAVDPNGLRPARFIGGEDKMSFVSASHLRIYKDSPESDLAKIAYELKRDSKNTDAPDTLVLVKSENTDVFASDDVRETNKHSYEILHGIKKLSYTYYQKDGNTWKTLKSWDSDHEETKNIIPDYIEINLEVKGPKNLSFEGKFKIRPELPINGLNSST